MPKEVSHWVLAEKIFREIRDDSPLKSIITDNKHAYLLGAVAPDTPFNAGPRKVSKAFTALAHSYHDTSLNSYTPIATMLSIALEKHPDTFASLPPALIALTCGIISHIQADAVFHPMVFYFSGKKDPDNKKTSRLSRIRHSRIETMLDIYYMQTFGINELANNGLHRNSRKQSTISLPELAGHLTDFYYNESGHPVKETANAIKNHSTIQAAYFGWFPKLLIRALLFLPDFPHLKNLFYPLRMPKKKLYPRTISYRHPVNGEELHYTIPALEKLTIDQTISVFNALSGHETVPGLLTTLRDLRGPNLCTGIMSVSTENMVHFNTKIDLNIIMGL